MQLTPLLRHLSPVVLHIAGSEVSQHSRVSISSSSATESCIYFLPAINRSTKLLTSSLLQLTPRLARFIFILLPTLQQLQMSRLRTESSFRHGSHATRMFLKHHTISFAPLPPEDTFPLPCLPPSTHAVLLVNGMNAEGGKARRQRPTFVIFAFLTKTDFFGATTLAPFFGPCAAFPLVAVGTEAFLGLTVPCAIVTVLERDREVGGGD